MRLEHQFVEFIPGELEEGTIYISKKYKTCMHLCACGCGERVILPLTETGWQLTMAEDTITLFPSIGNWSQPCRSHYWIKKSEVKWSYDMSDEDIEHGRMLDRVKTEEFYKDDISKIPIPSRIFSFLKKLIRWK